jgi:hypothetical protein
MANTPAQQIGWSTEAKLLWAILDTLNRNLANGTIKVIVTNPVGSPVNIHSI